MAITTLSMVLTVLVLNLHAISERPVPHYIRIIILEYLAKLFCRCDEHQPQQQSSASNHVRKKKKRKTVHLHHANPMHNNTGTDDDTDPEQVPIIALNGGINAPTPGVETTSFVFLSSNHQQNHNNIRTSDNHITSDTEVAVDPDFKVDYSKDWQRLAEIVDRMFFWTFLLAIIAISLLLFHPLTKDFIYGHDV